MTSADADFRHRPRQNLPPKTRRLPHRLRNEAKSQQHLNSAPLLPAFQHLRYQSQISQRLLRRPPLIRRPALYTLRKGINLRFHPIVVPYLRYFLHFLSLLIFGNAYDLVDLNSNAPTVSNDFDRERSLELGAEGDVEGAVIAVSELEGRVDGVNRWKTGGEKGRECG